MPAHMMATAGGASTCNEEPKATDVKQKVISSTYTCIKHCSTDMSLKNDSDNAPQQRLYFGRPIFESIALGSTLLVMTHAPSFLPVTHMPFV